MRILRTESAPRYQRPQGVTSYLLASPRTAGSSHLTVTVVRMEPGGNQRLHRHLPEQVYFIMEGRGLMTVGHETQAVTAGDCIFVPSDVLHGLQNGKDGTLCYLSAAAPAFEAEDLEAMWPISSEEEELRRP